MRKRAEQVDQTRQRIIEAAVHLHGTVGPAETTIAGIAREAGLTRLTIYRHFPDDDAIFAACSAHWMAGQVPPDPARWLVATDPLTRLQVGLADLYRFYRAGEAMLTRIYRDKASMPLTRQQAINQRDADVLCPAARAFRRHPRLSAAASRRRGPRRLVLDVAIPLRRKRPHEPGGSRRHGHPGPGVLPVDRPSKESGGLAATGAWKGPFMARFRMEGCPSSHGSEAVGHGGGDPEPGSAALW